MKLCSTKNLTLHSQFLNNLSSLALPTLAPLDDLSKLPSVQKYGFHHLSLKI